MKKPSAPKKAPVVKKKSPAPKPKYSKNMY